MPRNILSLQYEGKFLQDSYQLKDYNIKNNSTIILSLRLFVGAQGGRISIGSYVSFKKSTQGKPSAIVELNQNIPAPLHSRPNGASSNNGSQSF